MPRPLRPYAVRRGERMRGGNIFLLVLLGIVALPFYVMVLSMFVYIGKIAAMKAMASTMNRKKSN